MILNEIFGFGKKPQAQPQKQQATPRQAAPAADPLEQQWSSVKSQITPVFNELGPQDPLRDAVSQVAVALKRAFEFKKNGDARGFRNMSRQAAELFLNRVRSAHADQSTETMHANKAYRSPAVQKAIKAMVPFFQQLHKAIR